MEFFRVVILANYVSISGFIVVAIGNKSFSNITKENLMSSDVRKFTLHFWKIVSFFCKFNYLFQFRKL